MTTPAPTATSRFSLPRRLLYALLALGAYCILGVFTSSSENAWSRYSAWFGQPEEVLAHKNIGGADIYHVRLSEDQLADWIKTFWLCGDTEPSSPYYKATSSEHIQLKGEWQADNLYDVTLQKALSDISPNRSARHNEADVYELCIALVGPGPQDKATLGVHARDTEDAGSVSRLWRGAAMLIYLLIVSFLPAVVARLFVRPCEGCFPKKELFSNYLISLPVSLVFHVALASSILCFASTTPDTPLLSVISMSMVSVLYNAIACLIIFLVVGLYRRYVRKAPNSPSPA